MQYLYIVNALFGLDLGGSSMGSEHISTRQGPPSRVRIIAVLILVILLLVNIFIFTTPMVMGEDSSDTHTRGEEDEDETEAGSRDSNRTRENRRDTDNDGIDDEDEMEMGTDYEDPDTDSDGIPDGQDYYPLDRSLWRSPFEILMQVLLEIGVFLTLIFSYVAYRLLRRRREAKEEL
jgi:hypothetical protein